MEWFSWPLLALRNFVRPQALKKESCRELSQPFDRHTVEGRGRRKIPFYAHIPTWRIRSYQKYVDRAFSLSPTLEFVDGDHRFNDLLKEAASDQDISQLDLELMRIQYVMADPSVREQHRRNWAVKVINREKNDFFPSPWTILESVFTEKH